MDYHMYIPQCGWFLLRLFFTPGIVTSTYCVLGIPLRHLLSDVSTLSASPQCHPDKVDTLSL